MALVRHKPFTRFERNYDGDITVLEGSEMGALEAAFHEHAQKLANDATEGEFSNPADIIVLASVLAYQSVWGSKAVTPDNITDLSTADARKLDLLWRGMATTAGQYLFPDQEDWDAYFSENDNKSFLKALNEALELKPNVFGVGINLNSILDQWLKKQAEKGR